MAMLKKPSHTSYAYTSDSDLKTQCPACYTDSTSRVGEVFINKTKLPLYKCNSCSATYTKPHGDGGLEALAENLKDDYDTEDVSIVAGSGVTITNGTSTNVQDAINNLDSYITGGEVELGYSTKQVLEDIRSNTSNLYTVTSDISALESAVYTLINKLENLAIKNSELAERLATDPLINIREKVNKFNLE